MTDKGDDRSKDQTDDLTGTEIRTTTKAKAICHCHAQKDQRAEQNQDVSDSIYMHFYDLSEGGLVRCRIASGDAHILCTSTASAGIGLKARDNLPLTPIFWRIKASHCGIYPLESVVLVT